MQNATENKKAPAKRTYGAKSNATIVKMKAGDEIEGQFLNKTSGPWLNPETGEEQELVRLHFVDDRGTKFIIFEDGGLRNAMANANVQEKDFIKIVKLEKTDLGRGGRTVNNYDIFHAS